MKVKSTWGQGRGRGWARKRIAVFRRDAYTCQTCGRVTSRPECDHIVPLAQHGTDCMENLQTLCAECHRAKTAVEANGGRPVRILGCNKQGVPFARKDW